MPYGHRCLDQISEGVCRRPGHACVRPAGCGKTRIGNGVSRAGGHGVQRTGVFRAFEETGEEWSQNAASMGIDLPAMRSQKLLWIMCGLTEAKFAECGDYDLAGRCVRLEAAIKAIGPSAVLDTVRRCFPGLPT